MVGRVGQRDEETEGVGEGGGGRDRRMKRQSGGRSERKRQKDEGMEGVGEGGG